MKTRIFALFLISTSFLGGCAAPIALSALNTAIGLGATLNSAKNIPQQAGNGGVDSGVPVPPGSNLPPCGGLVPASVAERELEKHRLDSLCAWQEVVKYTLPRCVIPSGMFPGLPADEREAVLKKCAL